MSENVILGAVLAIVVSLIGAMVLGAFPDPQREIVNTLPDTNPNIKDTANKVLDVKDQVETAKEQASLMKKFGVLFLAIGLPATIIGGLVWRSL